MMKPTGWFQIGWSSDYPTSEALPRRYFGQELVVYRSEDGTLHALDAYCRHMGAHLGYGGKVEGDCIICPFHAWEWNSDGENTSIPYEDRPNRSRRLRAWPIVEVNDCVYLWHDKDGKPPSWDVPEMFESLGEEIAARHYHDSDPGGRVRCGILNLSPYVVLDNVGDMAHFRTVHGARDVPTVLHHQADQHRFLLRLGFGQSWKNNPTDGASGDVLDIVQLGVGVSYSVLLGRKLPAIVINLSTTPVGDETSEMFQTVWLERMDGDDVGAQLADRMHYACHQLPRDIEIWEHQCYEPHPAWGASEVRPFKAIRTWAQSFYESE
jgi:phenylpropionate dioxygenase-like ring-hydroxylating dioxygenase large terminal subunit